MVRRRAMLIALITAGAAAGVVAAALPGIPCDAQHLGSWIRQDLHVLRCGGALPDPPGSWCTAGTTIAVEVETRGDDEVAGAATCGDRSTECEGRFHCRAAASAPATIGGPGSCHLRIPSSPTEPPGESVRVTCSYDHEGSPHATVVIELHESRVTALYCAQSSACQPVMAQCDDTRLGYSCSVVASGES